MAPWATSLDGEGSTSPCSLGFWRVGWNNWLFVGLVPTSVTEDGRAALTGPVSPPQPRVIFFLPQERL